MENWALRLAEKAAAERPVFHHAVGAVLYRMGRMDESLKHLDAADAADKPQALTSPAYLNYFRAMAHQRLGHKEAARNWLERAVARTDQEVRDAAQDTSPETWVRRATLGLLRAEAQALLRGTAAEPDK
jgi:tetratricopeptide (TPR) repeat protein